VDQQNVQVIRPARIAIDYTGLTGPFAPVTDSVADVLSGHVPATQISNRYVLIGATAASLGDHFAAPFTHFTDVREDQHGSLMPGVEVLANALNTILRQRFYQEAPVWLTFLWAAVGLLGAAKGTQSLCGTRSGLALNNARRAAVYSCTWLRRSPIPNSSGAMIHFLCSNRAPPASAS
jgi:adenylate cyclase